MCDRSTGEDQVGTCQYQSRYGGSYSLSLSRPFPLPVPLPFPRFPFLGLVTMSMWPQESGSFFAMWRKQVAPITPAKHQHQHHVACSM